MKIVILVLFLFLFLPSTIFAADSLDQINQNVCDRFEVDAVRLAAIMEEIKKRKGITETRVAYGGVNTQIENADYWVNFAAEALAYQRVQKYSSQNQLRGSLEVLKNKILKAKGVVGKTLNE